MLIDQKSRSRTGRPENREAAVQLSFQIFPSSKKYFPAGSEIYIFMQLLR